jgi:hypothetical protein
MAMVTTTTKNIKKVENRLTALPWQWLQQQQKY